MENTNTTEPEIVKSEEKESRLLNRITNLLLIIGISILAGIIIRFAQDKIVKYVREYRIEKLKNTEKFATVKEVTEACAKTGWDYFYNTEDNSYKLIDNFRNNNPKEQVLSETLASIVENDDTTPIVVPENQEITSEIITRYYLNYQQKYKIKHNSIRIVDCSKQISEKLNRATKAFIYFKTNTVLHNSAYLVVEAFMPLNSSKYKVYRRVNLLRYMNSLDESSVSFNENNGIINNISINEDELRLTWHNIFCNKNFIETVSIDAIFNEY